MVSIGTELPFLNLNFNNGTLNISGIDDEKNPVTIYARIFAFSLSSGTLNFYNNWNGSYDGINGFISCQYSFLDWNSSYYNTDRRVIDVIPRNINFFKYQCRLY